MRPSSHTPFAERGLRMAELATATLARMAPLWVAESDAAPCGAASVNRKWGRLDDSTAGQVVGAKVP